MNITFDDAKITMEDGRPWLCLRVKDPAPARGFVLNKKKRDYTAEIKEYRKKRSLDANAYFWQLCGQLAEALNRKKEDLYRDYIKDYGIFRDFTLTEAEAKTLCYMWERHGTGWVTERVDFAEDGNRVVIRAYYGSSVYNTRQMSRLIDNVVQDCHAVGIETLTPLELERLKEEWQSDV